MKSIFFFTPKTLEDGTINLTEKKLPAFLISLSASFALLIVRTIAIPLPFTFVPIVFVSQAIFLLSWFLGAKKATLAVALFLFQASFIHLIQIGPLSGYQLGYLISAFFIGSASQYVPKTNLLKVFAIFSLTTFLLYFSGLAVLIPLIGLKKAILTGFLPFIIPDLLKNILVVKLLKKI